MLTAADAMQLEVETVAPGLGLVELERRFLTLGISGFPVLEDERLVGIVSRSDVVRILSVERSNQEQLADFDRAFDDPSQPAETETAEVEARVGRRAEGFQVRDAMVQQVVSVERDRPLEEVAQLMLDKHVHRLPVIDRDDGLVGLVTSLDLVRLFAKGHLIEAERDS
jgi:CBS domain-containing protein